MSSTRSPYEYFNFDYLLETIANPAAGAILTITVPTDHRSELINLSFKFTADANAANRGFTITHKRGTIHNLIGFLLDNITANEIKRLCFNNFQSHWLSSLGDYCPIPIASFPFVEEADTFDINVVNKQAGDQISEVHAAWKLWINPD